MDRRNGGTGAVRYADLSAKQKKAITPEDYKQAWADLTASKKWKNACERHGFTQEDIDSMED
jgi:hypothetical protein